MYSNKTLIVALVFMVASNIQAQSFSNQAAALGITNGYGLGTHGGGVSFCDFNRDGLDDLTFSSQNGDQIFFYQNNGNNSFTQLFLVDNSLQTKDITWVDYDNDGDRDLFVTVFNGLDRLYQNQGGMNMVDVTQAALPGMTNLKSMGAVWGDYNRDGWLDLYICHYYFNTPNTENDLYLSNGDGTFSRVTTSTPANNGSILTFDAIFVDLNENGWQDLYVVNDKYSMANALYLNTNGSFTAAPGQGADIAVDAMNAGGADYDDDGDFDIYITNCVQGNLLMQNDGTGQYVNVAPQTGVETFRACWGANFLDYDLDTDQDLYVSVQHPVTPNAMFENLSDQGFPFFQEPLEFSGGIGGEDNEVSFGNAIGDFNNDGLLDIAVIQIGDTDFRVWRNEDPTGNNWLKVDLYGTVSNAEGIGAKVEIDVDGKTLSRYRHGGQGYLSQNSAQLHFGLGSATQVDEIRVIWPSGLVDVYQDITNVNQVFFSTEGEALPAELISFSASPADEGVWLDWRSSSEQNLAYYEPQFSLDGRSFTALPAIQARGSLTETSTYRSLDQNDAPFPRYYRLRMVDWDEQIDYSQVVVVDRSASIADFVVGLPSPNPAYSHVNLPLTLPQPGEVVLQLHDGLGRTLLRRVVDVQSGQNVLRLPLTELQVQETMLFLSIRYRGNLRTVPLRLAANR